MVIVLIYARRADRSQHVEGQRHPDGPSDDLTRKGQTRSVVYSVRLTEDETAELQQIADGAGIPASGLVREWVLRGLAAEREAGRVDGLIETLSRDLERFRR